MARFLSLLGPSVVLVGSVVAIVACSSSDDTGGGGTSSSSGKPGASSSSGDITGSSSSSGSGTSSSSGGPNVSLTGYATAICEKVQKCQPGAFAQSWAIKAECIAEVEASNEEGLSVLPGSKVSKEQVEACSAKITESSCAFGLNDLEPCVLKGTLGPGTPCYDGRQCQTGRCKRAQLSNDCGTCAAFEASGGSCLEDPDCQFGLACGADGTCSPKLAKGATCSDDTKPCDAGLVCANGKCAEPSDKDGPCTAAGNECRRGLFCSGTTCKDQTFKVAALGESCDASTTCRKSTCRGAAGSEKCVAYAQTGDACSDQLSGAAGCDDDNTCAEGKCAANTYPECK